MTDKKITCKVCNCVYDYSRCFTGTGYSNRMNGCPKCFEQNRCEECGTTTAVRTLCAHCNRCYCGEKCFGTMENCYYCKRHHCKNCEKEIRARQDTCAFCKKIACNDCSDVGRFFNDKWACEECVEEQLVRSLQQTE